MIQIPNAPQAISKHIVLIGNTNVGKSSLLNALCEQDLALVSEMAGTTTDPVRKSYELLPFGPVVWIDTPGLSDPTQLGKERMSRSLKEIAKADYAILVRDAKLSNGSDALEIDSLRIPALEVFTKFDTLFPEEKTDLRRRYPNAELVSVYEPESIQKLKDRLANELSKSCLPDPLILCDKVTKGAHLLMVVPIDSEAPKGRIIAPQNALLREALEHGVICSVCTPNELSTLTNSPIHWDWIITDSQAFKAVDQILSQSYANDKRPRLTSFSILMSRQKGDLHRLVQGVQHIEQLRDNDRILIAEACSHTRSHEDIARVKIPALLQKKTKKKLVFEYVNGKNFPDQMDRFALIIHCGACMITRAAMQQRSALAGSVPMTNFGVVLAYLADILPLAIQDLD